MRVVVTGASGNVGGAVVRALLERPEVEQVVGVSRRAPAHRPPRTTWHCADLARDDLGPALGDTDAVVHLAWQFQPARRPEVTWRNNVDGTERLLAATVRARVPTVVVASSVGAYAPRVSLRPVTESWPTTGIAAAAYSREKSTVERIVRMHEAATPQQRLVTMRPSFIFRAAAADEQRRLFLGGLVPPVLLRPGVLPVLPLPSGLVFQAVHAEDVADAYVASVLGEARGPYNLAAGPTVDSSGLAQVLGSRRAPFPARALRGALAAAHAVRAVPASAGMFDMLMNLPVLDTGRAAHDLGWAPRHSSFDALSSFLGNVGSGLTGAPALDDPVT